MSLHFEFDMDSHRLVQGAATFEPRLTAAIGLLFERSGAQAEAYMKINAPWTDRTSNARNGLSNLVEFTGARWFLTLFGRVSYQIYLEASNGGKYAVIGPTLLIWGPRLMSQTRGLIERLGR
jgi:hypothetical protein